MNPDPLEPGGKEAPLPGSAPVAQRRGCHWPAALAFSVAVAAVASLLAFRWLLDAPGKLVGGLARETRSTAAAAAHGVAGAALALAGELDKALLVRPRVVVDERVIVDQEARAARLVLAEREFELGREMTHTFLHSTKRLEIRGRFRATAGFDFAKPVTLTADSGRVRLAVPPAEILSVELLDYRIVEDSNGLWNKVTLEDRERETRQLIAAARRRADALRLTAAAEAELRDRLKEIRARLPETPLDLDIRRAPAL